MFGKRRMVPADHKPFSGLPVEMIALRNAGIRAAVHISAPLVAGATPLVCLAGLHRNMSDFSTLAQAISSSTISRETVILIDLPGRGRADDRKNESDYNTIADARDVADILAALGVGRAVMLGQGHGGQVTLALAAAHPLLLGGVILLDAGPMVDSRGIFRLRNNLAHLSDLKGNRSVMAGFRRMLAGDYPELPTETLDALAQRSHFIDKKGRARPLFDERLLAPLASINFDDVLEAQWPLYDALRGVPLMILRTQLTDQLRRETYEEMVRRRPDAKAFTIAGQGSPALFDQHEEVDAILRFVTKAVAGRPARAA
jgi:pimeloyl-ACP methyl ester carboxylesterase